MIGHCPLCNTEHDLREHVVSVQEVRLGHDCAQVERDNIELHQALAEALRRMAIANRLLGSRDRIDSRDLSDILDRTSRPHAPLPPRGPMA